MTRQGARVVIDADAALAPSPYQDAPSTRRASAGCCWRPNACSIPMPLRSPSCSCATAIATWPVIVDELARTYNAPSERILADVISSSAGPRRQGRGDGVSVQPKPVENSGAALPPPVGLLAELTHRCPLQCPYCSNPLALESAAATRGRSWLDVLAQAADLGVLQLHLSGGEPTVRRDLEDDRRAGRQARTLHQPDHRRACC